MSLRMLSILAVVVVFIAADLILAHEFYTAAVMKGWTGRKYFWYSVFLPLAGYLLVIALPDRSSSAISALVSDDLPDLPD